MCYLVICVSWPRSSMGSDSPCFSVQAMVGGRNRCTENKRISSLGQQNETTSKPQCIRSDYGNRAHTIIQLMYLFSVALNFHCEYRVACLSGACGSYTCLSFRHLCTEFKRTFVICWSAKHRGVNAERSQHDTIFKRGGFVISFIKARSTSKKRQNPYWFMRN